MAGTRSGVVIIVLWMSATLSLPARVAAMIGRAFGRRQAAPARMPL
jgi:hypothetical protein